MPYKVLCDVLFISSGGFSLVKYDNCTICSLPNSKFSSSAVNPTLKDLELTRKHFESYGIPSTKKYAKVYDYAAKYGAHDLKYTALIGFDQTLHSPVNREVMKVPLNWAHFFEAIFVTTEPASALSDIHTQAVGMHTLFAQRIFLSTGVDETMVSKYTLMPVQSEYGRWVLDINFVGYLLENRGIFSCDTPGHFSEAPMNPVFYHQYMQTTVFKSINQALKVMQLCNVNGQYISMINGSSDLEQTEDIASICNALGGTITSHFKVLTDICAVKPNFAIGNEALEITCANWQETLSFTHDGNLLGLSLQANATLTIVAGAAYESQAE